jgi:AcrR family transcriptional regulator
MLDAAVAVFARRGYHAASMDEIADLAGISKPMVYLYVGNKEDLFVSCIRREAERLLAAISAEEDASLASDEQLWRGLRAFFAHVAAYPYAWILLHRHARANGEPFAGEVAAMRSLIIQFVAELVAGGARSSGVAVADADASALAHALVGACESMADWALDHPGEAPETTSVRLMNLTWVGMGNLVEGIVWHRPR